MKTLKYLERNFERLLLTGALIAMASVLFAQVVMRYFLRSPFSWSEELARYILVWAAIVGVSLAVRESRHIRVDFLPLVFGPRSERLFSIISHLGVLAFSLVMISAGLPLIERLARIGQTSPALGIPMWTIYLAIPVGFGLTVLRTLQALYFDIMRPRPAQPQEDV
ncbi:TRAP transporter small permease [Oceanicola sp. S124]|uniref:TRAP transporter small permease n=1 Tax=Oceanicola sp. S124 TaxID=1042378 RepID=UPI0002558557|nr:TRAP transporter small permease [Oceanicola sp. S124]